MLLPSHIQCMNAMHKYGFVKWSTQAITLKSGKKSHVYVYGMEDITDNPDFLSLISGIIYNEILKVSEKDNRQPCLIGIPTAGTPLAQAASMMSVGYLKDMRKFHTTLGHKEGAQGTCSSFSFRIMREKKKEGYGVHSTWVNGKPNPEKHVYCVIDNVATDGGSKIEIAKRLEEDGYPSRDKIHWIILVDREQGAEARLKAEGFKNIYIIFTLRDIINHFSKQGFWTPEMAKLALSELSQ